MLKKVAPGEPELTGNARFEGYCVDLLEKLAKNITGFEYDIFVSFENRYGARQPDGSWDGMIGYLLNEVRTLLLLVLKPGFQYHILAWNKLEFRFPIILFLA